MPSLESKILLWLLASPFVLKLFFRFIGGHSSIWESTSLAPKRLGVRVPLAPPNFNVDGYESRQRDFLFLP